jgi:hypothetical protein
VWKPKSKTDALGRRKRGKRQPTGKKIYPRPRDLIWYEKLHHHGALSTQFLHAFTKHIARDYKCATKRMADLFHEINYLGFPGQQDDTYNAQGNYNVYDLAEGGEEVLKGEELWSERAPSGYGIWKHRFMVSCITASVELATIENPHLRYIPQHEILERADTVLRSKVSYQNPITKREETRNLIPDALFGIEYQQGEKRAYRFFLVEADRATEPNRAKPNKKNEFDRKSHRRSVLQYREFIGRGLYKEHFKIKGSMVVLTVTTSERKMQNIIDVVREQSTNGKNSFMLFQYVPAFGRYFKPPMPLYELLTKPWLRAGHQPFVIDRP